MRFFLLFLVLLGASCSVQARTTCDKTFYFSSSAGRDSYECVSPLSPCQTLGKGLDLADGFDASLTVCLTMMDGDYTIPRPITRPNLSFVGNKGVSDASSRILCPLETACFDLRTHNTTLKNIEIQNEERGMKASFFEFSMNESVGPQDFSLLLSECRIGRVMSNEVLQASDMPSLFHVPVSDPPIKTKILLDTTDFSRLSNVKLFDIPHAFLSLKGTTFYAIDCGFYGTACISLHVSPSTTTKEVLVIRDSLFKNVNTIGDFIHIHSDSVLVPFSVTIESAKLQDSKIVGDFVNIQPSNNMSLTMNEITVTDTKAISLLRVSGTAESVTKGKVSIFDFSTKRVNQSSTEIDYHLINLADLASASIIDISGNHNKGRLLSVQRIPILTISDSEVTNCTATFVKGKHLGFFNIGQSSLLPNTLSVIENTEFLENLGDSALVFDPKLDLVESGSVKAMNDLKFLGCRFEKNQVSGPTALVLLSGANSHVSFSSTYFKKNSIEGTLVGCDSLINQIPISVYFQGTENKFTGNTSTSFYSPSLGSANECKTSCALHELGLCGKEPNPYPPSNMDSYGIGVLIGWCVTIGLMLLLASFSFVAFVFRKRIAQITRTISPQEVFSSDSHDSLHDADL